MTMRSLLHGFRLIKNKVIPSISNEGKISWIGTGTKTVDFGQILERYESLNITIDWNPVERLQKYRNNIEHYFDCNKLTKNVLIGYISDGFDFVNKFLKQNMHKKPEEIFPTSIKEMQMTLKQEKENNQNEMITDFSKLHWFNDAALEATKFFMCPCCGNQYCTITNSDISLEAVKAKFQCTNCKKIFSYHDYMKEVISNANMLHPYNSEGIAQSCFTKCKNCNEFSFDVLKHICYLCGCETQKCAECGKSIDLDDIHSFEQSNKCKKCSVKHTSV